MLTHKNTAGRPFYRALGIRPQTGNRTEQSALAYTRSAPQPDMLTRLDLQFRDIQQRLSDRVISSPFPRDDALIARHRQQLASHPLAERAYSRLQRLLASDERLGEMTIADMAGSQAASVFTRASGLPLTEGVPGMYSYNGYWKVFNDRVGDVSSALRRDDAWILELPAPSALDPSSHSALSAEVKRLYFNDYIRQWDTYLADLRLIRADSLLQSIQTARTLSTAESPLVRLVQSVARETTLLRDENSEDFSLVDRARARADGATDTLQQLFGPVGPIGGQREDARGGAPEAVVDRHFEPWRRLAQGNASSPPPIMSTVHLIDELYTYLTSADAALRSGNTAPNAEIATKLRAEAGRTPDAVRQLLDRLSLDAMAEVSNIMRSQLGDNVSATIGLFCRQSIAGRYPFAPGAGRDAAPSDVARLFAPNGMMDEFIQKHLAGQIDVSSGRWRFKPGMDGTPAEGSTYLDAFQQATVIRDVFFTEGLSTPSFRVSIRPVQMDERIHQFVMDVDGQRVQYAHGPQVATPVQWPGPRGTNQVRLELQPSMGTSSITTSGPWALNRMLDRAQIKRGPTPETLFATFDLGGRKLVLEITASSVKHPFHLPEARAFACPGIS